MNRIILILAVAGAAVLLFSACSQKTSSTPNAGGGSSAPAKTSVTHANPEQAQKLITDGKVAILDLRTPEEYQGGRLAHATNIDFMAPDFEQRLGPLNRDQCYLIHCASGGRSTRALRVFEKLGFKSVVHLDGGMGAWESAGKPVEK